MAMGVLVVVVMSAFSGVAAAQKTGSKPIKRSDSCAEQRKHDKNKACNLDIDGETLEGDKISPDGEQFLAHPPAQFGSLIRYRTTMLDKMSKDTDRF